MVKEAQLKRLGIFTTSFMLVMFVITAIALCGLVSNEGLEFYPTGLIGNITVKTVNEEFRIIYEPSSEAFSAVYWQFPPYNWGNTTGRDLTGFRRLIFEARIEKGNLHPLFAVGYPVDNHYAICNDCQLTGDWSPFAIDLSEDLSNVTAGFGCIFKGSENLNRGEISIRNIYYVL